MMCPPERNETIGESAETRHRQRMNLKGHAKALLMAALFGLGAYAVIRLLIWLSHSLGSTI